MTTVAAGPKNTHLSHIRGSIASYFPVLDSDLLCLCLFFKNFDSFLHFEIEAKEYSLTLSGEVSLFVLTHGVF